MGAFNGGGGGGVEGKVASQDHFPKNLLNDVVTEAGPMSGWGKACDLAGNRRSRGKVEKGRKLRGEV